MHTYTPTHIHISNNYDECIYFSLFATTITINKYKYINLRPEAFETKHQTTGMNLKRLPSDRKHTSPTLSNRQQTC